MKVVQLFFISLLFGIAINSAGQVTFILESLPQSTPKGSSFYLAGSINGWIPGDNELLFTQNNEGVLSLTIDSVAYPFDFKLCRGTWASVEVDSLGRDIPNRTYHDSLGQVIKMKVGNWRDRIQPKQVVSTASSNVHFTPTSIEIPYLKKRRTVRVYFPPNYSTQQAFPVIYMFDGQNIFDASTSFAGEWRVDEILDSLYYHRGFSCIVVAIYHAESDRITEYTPWPNAEKVGGDGQKFARFIVKDLKPYIDRHYRTNPDREHTIIIGSSLGGLMSLYLALEYPDVFGKAGIFSPSLWWSEKAFEQITKYKKKRFQKLYMLGGEKESEKMIQDLRRAESLLKESGFGDNELNIKVYSDGNHSEWFWSREFPRAINWLFEIE